jgi:hypothetical protein
MVRRGTGICYSEAAQFMPGTRRLDSFRGPTQKRAAFEDGIGWNPGSSVNFSNSGSKATRLRFAGYTGAALFHQPRRSQANSHFWERALLH